MTKVFVSSIARGFEEYRQIAIEAVSLVDGMHPIYFESWPAMADTCQQACLSQVGECDVYLGVLGPVYGRRTQSGMSAVEEEYREAHRLGKRIILFVSDGLLDEDQLIFVNSLGEWETATFRHNFYSPAHLRDEIVRALTREVRRTSLGVASPRLEVVVTPALVERGSEGLVIALPGGHEPLSRRPVEAAHLAIQGGGALVSPVKLFLGIECVGAHDHGLHVSQLVLDLVSYTPFEDEERVDLERHTVPQAGGRERFYLELIAGVDTLDPHSYHLLRPYWDDDGRRRVPNVIMRDGDTVECLLTIVAPRAGKYEVSLFAELTYDGSDWRQALLAGLHIYTLDSPRRIERRFLSWGGTPFTTEIVGEDGRLPGYEELQYAAAQGAIQCRPFPCRNRSGFSPMLQLGSEVNGPMRIQCWRYFGDADIGILDSHSSADESRLKCLGGCPRFDGPEAAHRSEPYPLARRLY